MEASPRGDEADLESFWLGTGGSVCDSSDIALSALVLSDSSSSTGAGCYGTDVAEGSSVCLSPDLSAPGSSRESVPEWGPAVASSSVQAGPSMVLGPDFSSRRLSMGDSCQEGSPLTGGGYDPSPLPGVMEAVCVAPEGAQIIASGLSTEVISERLLSLKTVLLLALSSLKRVGDLQALSVAPSYLEFAPGLAKACLYRGAGYVPKVPSSVPRPVVL